MVYLSILEWCMATFLKAACGCVLANAGRAFAEAHFATFPEILPATCIKAACPVGSVVLDLFGGSGTTGLVAQKLYRKWLAIELNKGYIDDIANPRLVKELGLFI